MWKTVIRFIYICQNDQWYRHNWTRWDTLLMCEWHKLFDKHIFLFQQRCSSSKRVDMRARAFFQTAFPNWIRYHYLSSHLVNRTLSLCLYNSRYSFSFWSLFFLSIFIIVDINFSFSVSKTKRMWRHSRLIIQINLKFSIPIKWK